MIISASRRTDIPAFYATWFINRIREGYCVVPNPFNPHQVSTVSLKPEDVAVIVFWTRNPHPLLPYLQELDERGYRYYFQYTLLNNPRQIDPKTPPAEAAIQTFRELSAQIGPQRVIWRYDPIVFTSITDAQFHLQTYQIIAEALKGYTRRCVISIMDAYAKAKLRLAQMAEQGAALLSGDIQGQAWFEDLMVSMASIARQNGMQIFSCAEATNLQSYGISPGKCVDDDYIQQVFGIDVTHKKDPSQRAACGCVVSKDIGVYDTCLFGCRYCYATKNFDLAQRHYQEHDPASPALIRLNNIEPTTPC